MLRAIPKGWWTLKYELLDNEEVVGLVEFHFATEGATITIGSEVYEARGKGWFNREYFFETAERRFIASAENPAFSGRFEVNFDNRLYSLQKDKGLLNTTYVLIDGDGVIGSITPDGIFSRKSTIDIQNSFPLPIQAFMFWLVALLWKRATDSTAGAT
jgi:hypothetical protein